MIGPPQRTGRAGLCLALIAAAVILLHAHQQAYAQQSRFALVIGNSAYSDQPLPNPVNDANLIATSLEGLGFKVFKHLDIDQKGMRRAIRDFGDAMAAQDGNVVSLIYYAGHGVQVDGRNYMVPVDARINSERDVAIEAIAADDMLAMVGHSDTKLNIVILDACRNNPYQRSFRSAGGRGLARMDAPSGTILSYATAPGQVAADGDGRNSPFTQALVRAMNRPGLAVEEVFKRVRIEVMDRTGNQQIPWESSSLTGDFYFSGPQPAAEAENTVANAEVAFWTSIVTENDPALFRSYLDQYPDGAFVPIARTRLHAIENGTASPGGTAQQVASLGEARTPGVLRFASGKYKLDVIRGESQCNNVEFSEVTAEDTAALGRWHLAEHNGRIEYAIEDGIISVDFQGREVRDSSETVQVRGRDLFVRLDVRHMAGRCQIAYHLRGMIAQ